MYRTRISDWIRRVCVLLLLPIPFLPLQELFGPLKGLGTMTPTQWALGLLIGLGSFALGGILCKKLYLPTTLPLPSPLFICLLLLSTTTIHFYSFQDKPQLIDSIIQLFQAKIFAAGKLYADLPKHYEFFMTQHMVHADGRWYSQYPPLHSLILALGIFTGGTWLLPPIMTCVTAICVVEIAREIYNPRVARLTAFLLLLSPFVQFMGASYMNHVSTACLLSVAVLAAIKWLKHSNSLWLALEALFLGLAISIRPLNAIAFGLVLVPTSGFKAIKQKRYTSLVVAGLIGISATLLYPLYNYLVIGDPFMSGYEMLWGQAHNPGFHMSPWGKQHTLSKGLINQVVNLYVLNEFLFESNLPALFPLLLAVLLTPFKRKNEYLLPALLISTMLLFVFYWHRDDFLGPRYLYEAAICTLPIHARALRTLLAWSARRSWGFFSVGCATKTTLLTGLFFTVCLGFPGKLKIYSGSLASIKQDFKQLVDQAHISEGIVFIKVSWGNRLIARLHAAGISASLTQQAYNKLDHCILHQAIESFANNQAGLANELTQAMSRPSRVKYQWKSIDGIEVLDSTMALVRGTDLPDICLDELRYDSTGFVNFSPALPLNDPDLKNAIIYARDQRERNPLLLKTLNKRTAFLFDGKTIQPLSLG